MWFSALWWCLRCFQLNLLDSSCDFQLSRAQFEHLHRRGQGSNITADLTNLCSVWRSKNQARILKHEVFFFFFYYFLIPNVKNGGSYNRRGKGLMFFFVWSSVCRIAQNPHHKFIRSLSSLFDIKQKCPLTQRNRANCSCIRTANHLSVCLKLPVRSEAETNVSALALFSVKLQLPVSMLRCTFLAYVVIIQSRC